MLSQAECVFVEAKRDAALGRKRCFNEPSSGQRADMGRLLEPTGHILVHRSDRSDFLLYKLQTAAKEAKFESKDETVLLTTVTAQIVGLDHHPGKTGAGDTVVVAHERENKYDANAVSIHSFHDHSDRVPDDDNRVGYLAREQAAAISGLMSIPFGNLEEERAFDVSGIIVGGVPKAKAYFPDDVDDYDATYDEHGEEGVRWNWLNEIDVSNATFPEKSEGRWSIRVFSDSGFTTYRRLDFDILPKKERWWED